MPSHVVIGIIWLSVQAAAGSATSKRGVGDGRGEWVMAGAAAGEPGRVSPGTGAEAGFPKSSWRVTIARMRTIHRSAVAVANRPYSSLGLKIARHSGRRTSQPKIGVRRLRFCEAHDWQRIPTVAWMRHREQIALPQRPQDRFVLVSRWRAQRIRKVRRFQGSVGPIW